MQQIEIVIVHLLMKYAGIGKLFDAWNSPTLEGYRTYASLLLLGIAYELHKYGIAPFNNEQVYQAFYAAFGTTGVLGLYEKFQRAHPRIELVQGVLDDLVDDVKKNQPTQTEAPK